MIMKYRKRAEEVEAWRFGVGGPIPEWVSTALVDGRLLFSHGASCPHFTINAWRIIDRVFVDEGDWLILRPDGTILRCSDGLFERVYEQVEAPS